MKSMQMGTAEGNLGPCERVRLDASVSCVEARGELVFVRIESGLVCEVGGDGHWRVWAVGHGFLLTSGYSIRLCCLGSGEGGVVLVVRIAEAIWQEALRYLHFAELPVGRLGKVLPEKGVNYPKREAWLCPVDRARGFGSEHPCRETCYRGLVIDIALCFGPFASAEKGPPGWLREARGRMRAEENLEDGLARMIELSGHSQEHMTRLFHQHYGQRPTEYLNDLRLDRAVRALVESETGILEIALESGFNSLSYFNRLFQKRFGCSPGVFRGRHRRG